MKGKMFKKQKNRKTKTNLVFDDTARKEYLTGFRKRKQERRKKAMEEMIEKQKEERRELRKQKRELLQFRMRKGLSSVPEVEELVQPEVYSLPDHTVTVTDVSNIDLAGHDGLRLGQNTFVSEDKETDNLEESAPENVPDIKRKVKKIDKKSKLLSIQRQNKRKKLKKSLNKQSKKKGSNSSKTKKKKGKKKH